MEIYKFSELTRAKRGAVVAIGFFDGVHLGHRHLISEARAIAKKISAPLGIFTFSSKRSP